MKYDYILEIFDDNGNKTEQRIRATLDSLATMQAANRINLYYQVHKCGFEFKLDTANRRYGNYPIISGNRHH